MRYDPPSSAKVIHLCDVTMLYAAHSGGVRSYIEAKHAWLSRRAGVRHSVVAPRDGDGRLVSWQQALGAWPLPFTGGFRFPWRIEPWRSLLEELSPDLIEAGDPYRLGWAALEAGQRLGVPTTTFYHSDLPALVAARFGRLARHLARRYVARFYARFEAVVAPSRAAQRVLQELGVAHVRVRPLGVDVERFHPRRRSGALRRLLKLKPGTRLLVFAGRNAREKHPDSLLQAARLLGDGYHLLLAGPGMPHPAQANASAISRYVDAHELAGLLADSDALLHAGDGETFGLVVLEAMASGIPVVGVDAGAVPELLTPTTGVLARSSAPCHLAEAVTALFERDARQMGRSARRAVESRWTWDHAFRGLLAIYGELLAEPCAGVGEDLVGVAG